MSRPVRDKWKMKKWFTIVAPPMFGEAVLGTTPADDPDKLIGRVIEVTLFDLTGDLAYAHVKLYFQVVKVEGEKAYTRFKGHELLRDYVRSLTRRKSSKITGIFNVWTKDGYGLRLTCTVWTKFKCKTSQKTEIRKSMKDVITKTVSEKTLEELVNTMIYGDREGSLAQLVDSIARKIYPTRKVEVTKSKLLWIPGPSGPERAVVVSPLQFKVS